MNGEDKRYLDQRLNDLKDSSKEQWETHRQHSDQKWGEVRDQISKIFDKLDVLPALVERIKGINGKMAWLWGIVVMVVGYLTAKGLR